MVPTATCHDRNRGCRIVATLFVIVERHIGTWGFLDARCIVQAIKGLADASVSQFLSYLGEQIEVAPPGPVPTEWMKDEATAAD